MDDILKQLAALLADLPPHLGRAARAILDRPNVVAVLSMRALAAEVKVSPPTMLRLARRLGFGNYEDFRAVFQAGVTGGRFGQKAQRLQQVGAASGRSAVVGSMMQAAANNVARCAELADLKQMERAADILRKAPACYCLGGGALYWMSSYLQYLGRAALPQMRVPPANGNAMVEGLAALRRGDAVLILSAAPYSTQAVRAAEFSRAAGAAVLTITDSRGSPLAPFSDVTLVAGTESPQFYPSMIGIVTVLEALIAVTISGGGKPMLKRIAVIDQLRRNEGGYLD